MKVKHIQMQDFARLLFMGESSRKPDTTRLQDLARLVAANQRTPLKITYPTRHIFDLTEAELIEKFQGPKREVRTRAGESVVIELMAQAMCDFDGRMWPPWDEMDSTLDRAFMDEMRQMAKAALEVVKQLENDNV